MLAKGVPNECYGFIAQSVRSKPAKKGEIRFKSLSYCQKRVIKRKRLARRNLPVKKLGSIEAREITLCWLPAISLISKTGTLHSKSAGPVLGKPATLLS